MNTATPRDRAICSISRVRVAKNGSEMSGMATPIAASRPERKVRARRFGT